MLGLLLAASLGLAPEPIAPGNQTRTVRVETKDRPYLLHAPPSFDPKRPTPVVLALHPFATDGPMMAVVSGLSRTADREGFLVAYPNGTGRGSFLHWNVGALPRDDADDVGYLGKVLDDIEASAKVDTKRVYAVGYSNGGMMCYRLASALPGRIAAIASVAGTMTASKAEAKRPVSVLHFHGTKDTMVPFDGSAGRANGPFRLRSVDESIRAWAEADGCPKEPQMAEIPAKNADALAVRRLTFGPGREGSEVVLYVIEGGGHTWPGKPTVGPLLGKSAVDLKANDLIWEFFKKHPIP